MTTTKIRHACKLCHRSVLWTVNERSGARLPIDPEPAVGGNVRLVAPGPPPVARVLDKDALGTLDLFDDTDDGVRYTKHTATCPIGHPS